MHTNKLLYFSLDKEARKLFHQYAEESRAVYEHPFQFVDKNSELCEYGHASDLMVILEHIDQHEDLGHFFVIIDYLSLCSNEDKSNKEFDSPQRASDIIRRAILKYPDILFLFDESGAVKINASDEVQKKESGDVQKDEKVQYLAAEYDFSDFLFNCSGILKHENHPAPNCFRKELHQFNVCKNHDDPFSFISRGRDNLFDGSNLRYFVKKYLYKDLCVHRENFRFIQESRANHLAFCIENEPSQNEFNSYALYVNGFRVTQVLSAEELKFLNGKLKSEDNNKEQENAQSENSELVLKEFLKPDIIVRDFDLQFNDIDTSNKTETCIIENICFPINEIDKIRKAKFFDTNSYCKQSKPDKDKVRIDDSLVGKWKKIEDNNPYWSNIEDFGSPAKFCGRKSKDFSTYYITKKEDNIVISHSQKEYISRSGKKLILPGLIKPVSGLYTSYRQFDKIKKQVDSIKKDEKEAKKKKEYSISEKRKNHNHSRPLHVYGSAKRMIERAENCYTKGAYVRSAVIASEAIEVLNGFHTSLMLKAYSTKFKAENAIAVDILGGSEKELCVDACERIKMIKKAITRLLRSNKEQSINVLSQIFSDCRNYCKEKEHFEAEDVFLDAMAKLNEGGLRPMIKKIKDLF